MMGNAPSLKDEAQTPLSGEILQPLFAVRWMEREYEEGWGINDRESKISLHPSLQDAQNYVEKHFPEGERSLYGAGDYFTYPAGPDHAFVVYEMSLAPDNEIFRLMGDETVLCIDLMDYRNPATMAIKQEIITVIQERMGTQQHTVPCPGLHPKPTRDVPVYCFSTPKTGV
jgi:hypothetical protein